MNQATATPATTPKTMRWNQFFIYLCFYFQQSVDRARARPMLTGAWAECAESTPSSRHHLGRLRLRPPRMEDHLLRLASESRRTTLPIRIESGDCPTHPGEKQPRRGNT